MAMRVWFMDECYRRNLSSSANVAELVSDRWTYDLTGPMAIRNVRFNETGKVMRNQFGQLRRMTLLRRCICASRSVWRADWPSDIFPWMGVEFLEIAHQFSQRKISVISIFDAIGHPMKYLISSPFVWAHVCVCVCTDIMTPIANGSSHHYHRHVAQCLCLCREHNENEQIFWKWKVNFQKRPKRISILLNKRPVIFVEFFFEFFRSAFLAFRCCLFSRNLNFILQKVRIFHWHWNWFSNGLWCGKFMRIDLTGDWIDWDLLNLRITFIDIVLPLYRFFDRQMSNKDLPIESKSSKSIEFPSVVLCDVRFCLN